VGDGIRIHFWLDNWCANVNLVTLLNISDISQIDASLMVSHFITDAKEWDVTKLKEVMDDVHLQLILATPIPLIPSLTLFVGDFQEMKIFPRKRQLGLPMA